VEKMREEELPKLFQHLVGSRSQVVGTMAEVGILSVVFEVGMLHGLEEEECSPPPDHRLVGTPDEQGEVVEILDEQEGNQVEH